jgi:signal transduction histidine kinase
VHRQLFVLFGVSMVGTAVIMGIIFALVTPRASSFRYNVERVQRYVGNRFAEVWADPAQRAALAEGAARDLEVHVTLQDAAGGELSRHGGSCRSWKYTVPVERAGQRLGAAIVCVPPRHSRGPAAFLAVLAAAVGSLWFFTGLIARRLVKPLDRLVTTARAIGDGDLARRSGMHRDQYGEMGVLGETLDDMAERISQQLADQRELLAVVSHEIRSPLARLRVHLELLEERGVAPDTIEKMTAEAVEMDRLVGDLLASARLEFSVADGRPVDLAVVTRGALNRLGLSEELLVAPDVTRAVVDPTLFSRALENLLENAQLHAGGVRQVVISRVDSQIRVEVLDDGPGFPANLAGMAFDSFVRGRRSAGSSLGLGLSLVRRVASAHGGRCWAEARAEGGSVVGFSVPAVGESPGKSAK